jgi:poly(hydroxyalkanoate) depolymerase family esterase
MRPHSAKRSVARRRRAGSARRVADGRRRIEGLLARLRALLPRRRRKRATATRRPPQGGFPARLGRGVASGRRATLDAVHGGVGRLGAAARRGRAGIAGAVEAALAGLHAAGRRAAGVVGRLAGWSARAGSAVVRVPRGLLAGGALRRRSVRALAWWRGRLPRVLHPGERDIACEFQARDYPGSRNRLYLVHLPPAYDARRPLPLVMVLHGCRQHNDDIRHITNFDAVADREGFIVVYPFVTSYVGLRTRNCWGWWSANQIRAGAGEVEDLWQIIEEVRSRHAVDARRIHVTGLSSGGGMTVAMLVAHAGRIASGAPVAGVPYHESPRAVSYAGVHRGSFKPVARISAAMRDALGDVERAVPILIVHSDGDATVEIQAAHNLRDSWAECFGIDLKRRVREKAGTTQGTEWRHARYRDAGGRSVIETLLLAGPGHGWYGGGPGRYSYPDAPDVSAMVWQFFRDHPLERGVARPHGSAQPPASPRKPSGSGRRPGLALPRP